jgi:acyl carrier protein
MSEKAFLESMAAIFEVEADEVNESYELTEKNWDSLVIVSTIALIDRYFDLTVNGRSLLDCKDIGSLLKVIRESKKA